MEGKNFLRCLFFICSVVLIMLFTAFNFPTPLSDKSELLECATNSAWCTAKNRILRHPNRAPLGHDHTADVPHHPLDPLTIQEMNKVQKVIKSFFGKSVYSVHSLVLEDPEKQVVLKWQKGDPLPPRKASVIARAAGEELLADGGPGERGGGGARHQPHFRVPSGDPGGYAERDIRAAVQRPFQPHDLGERS
ncbi:UNVERIFIED_CONTAM: Primary amine oxidase [Sesamum angustifolium]|uniref:Primary amine oxidase n=1 Tax=Sesamum angustifolium TaxID=2727405 RepID=A0AAW2MIN8_9LAMI